MKRKLSAIKALEDETIEIETDLTVIETLINEGALFKVSSKAKLNISANF